MTDFVPKRFSLFFCVFLVYPFATLYLFNRIQLAVNFYQSNILAFVSERVGNLQIHKLAAQNNKLDVFLFISIKSGNGTL